MSEDVIAKLEDAFSNAFTDEMACLFANISVDSLYRYCQKNPKFAERKKELKISPDLQAQKKLVADTKNTNGARWWAEHRMQDFMPKTKVELSGGIFIEPDRTKMSEEEQKALDALRKARRERIEKRSDEME